MWINEGHVAGPVVRPIGDGPRNGPYGRVDSYKSWSRFYEDLAAQKAGH